MTTGLYLFSNDLRLHDNPALQMAADEVDTLLCVYCLPLSKINRLPYHTNPLGPWRQQFLLQSLADLAQQLTRLGQQLLIVLEHPLNTLPALITQYNVTSLYRSQHAGTYENQSWQALTERYPYLSFTTTPSHTLFTPEELPFHIEQLPPTFSQFRKRVDELPIRQPLPNLTRLPAPPKNLLHFDVLSPLLTHHRSMFQGGEQAALGQLETYFSSRAPSNYKQTRNALDGWESSTKFSPWLALGSLSANTLIERLHHYESHVERNNSTAWIKFELLWREYFQWYAHRYPTRLFAFRGIKPHGPNTSYYAERYRRWCNGNTPYPIVNACMHQLNQTGYMSNRGRQLVASCLVHELSLDWRYGAAYFEQQLLDYDVASNWGNWQYIAGVGADPKEHRHFHLEKQTQRYDPDGTFIRKWKGDQHDGNLDAVDAADWPQL